MPAQFPTSPYPPAVPTARDHAQWIERQLGRTGTHVKTVDVLGGLLALLTAVLGFVLGVTILDHWLVPGGLGTVMRTLLAAVLVGGVGYYVSRNLWPLLLRRIHPLYAAQTIEQSKPGLKNSLINLLTLRASRAAIPAGVYRAVEHQAAQSLRHVAPESTVDLSRLVRGFYVLLAVATTMAMYVVFSMNWGKDPFRSVGRLLLPWADIAAPTRVRIDEVLPGDVDVARGGRFTVSAVLEGLHDDEPVTLVYRSADGQTVDQSIPMGVPEGDYRYACQFPSTSGGVGQDMTYRIVAGDALTRWFHVTVVDTPTLVVDYVDYDFPEYTGLTDDRVAGEGNLRGVEGTRVTIHAIANHEILTAYVELDGNKRSKTMTAKGRRASVSLDLAFADRQARRPEFATYRLRYRTADGRTNPEPVDHLVEVLPDLTPEIERTAPAADEISLPADGAVALEFRAVDPDYALEDVRVWGQIAGRPGTDTIQKPLLGDDKRPWQGKFAGRFQFIPRDYRLKAGDVVTYWAVAKDNRAPSANVSKTPEYRIRITLPEREPEPNNDPKSKKPQDDPPQDDPPKGDPTEPQDDGQDGMGESPDGAAAQENKAKPGDMNPAGDDKKNPDPDDPSAGDRGDPKSEAPKKPSDGGDGKDVPPEKNGDSQRGKKADETGDEKGKDEKGSKDEKGKDEKGKDEKGGGSDPQGAEGAGNNSADAKGEKDSKGGGKKGQPSQESDGEPKSGGASDGTNGKNGKPAGNADPSAGDAGESSADPDSASGGKSGAGNSKADEAQAIERLLENLKREQGKPGAKENAPRDGSAEPDDTEGVPESVPDESPSKVEDKASSGKDGAADDKSGAPGVGDEKSKTNPSVGDPETKSAGGGAKKQEADASKPKPQDGDGTPEPATDGASREGADGASRDPGDTEKPALSDKTSKDGDDGKKNEDENSGGKGNPGASQKGRADSKDNKTPEPQEDAPDRSDAKNSESSGDSTSDSDAKSPAQNKKKSNNSEGESQGDRSGGGGAGGGENANQGGKNAAGSNTDSDKGAGVSKVKGDGVTGKNQGDGKQSDGKTGKSGDKRGDGTDEREGGSEAGGTPSDAGEGTESDPNKTGERPAGRSGQPVQGGNAADDRPPRAPDNEPKNPPPPVEQNVDDLRKAADLALEHLQDKMNQGDDADLLKKLGWSRDEAQQMLRNWDRMKNEAKTDSGARRALDDHLRSLGLRDGRREAAATGARDDAIRSRNTGPRVPVPDDYAEQFRAYSKGVRGGPARAKP